MRKGKITFLIYLLAALIITSVPSIGYADGDTLFALKKSAENVEPDSTLEVTLNGNNLKELYAYEAVITFDPDLVELDKAESKINGYFISPKVNKGEMILAFTKLGKNSGEQGTKVLSIIAFKGKAQGDPNIKLISVKALDSSLTATEYKYGTSFTDLAGYKWASMEIETLAAAGIIKGTSATTFSPGNPVTRADFITLLIRAFKFDADVDSNFSDVKQSDYYYKELGIAKKLGIAMGTGSNQLEPKINISRQDMMVLAARAMKIAGAMQEEQVSDLSSFHDSKEVAAYAIRPLAQLVKEGIIKGDNGMIKPRGTAIRAEAAVIIYRLLNK